MKTFIRKAIITSVFSISFFNSICYASENTFNIKFEDKINDKYLKMINVISDTSSEKISDNTYKIKTSKNIYDSMAFFSTIPDITKTEINTVEKKSGDIIEGQIIVRFKNNVTKTKIVEIDNKLKTKSILLSSALNLYKIILPERMSVNTAIETYKKTNIIEYAEPDRILKIQNNSFGIQPVNEKVLALTLKKGSENIIANLLNIIYDNSLVKDTNSGTYNLTIRKNIDDNLLIKAFRTSPYIIDVKISSGKK